MRKLVLFTAPSGAGKTTIVKRMLQTFDHLAFSVSATTRPKRSHEIEGQDYYFLDTEEFLKRIEAGEFVEWEEVYAGTFYGTLKKEVERLWRLNKDVVFDVDVQGAIHIKNIYPEQTLAIFVKPPSKDVLLNRLMARQTENEETLKERLNKAEEELKFENKFDYVLVNDVLETAVKEAESVVRTWLSAS